MRQVYILILLLISLNFNLAIAREALSLEESKMLALQNNYQAKNSELEIGAARQTRISAIAKYFPSISAVGVEFKAHDPLMEIGLHGLNMGFLKNGAIGYISATQPVFAGGRIINGNRLAGLGEDVSELQNKITRDEVILKTEEQYWQIISLQEKYKTIEKYEEMLDSLLKQVDGAYNSGIVMKNDVLKVKLKRSEVLLNKSKLNNGMILAQMAFCQYLGISYDPGLTLTDTLNIGEPPQIFYVENSQALKNRSEYRLLESSVRAEKLQTKMTLGEFLPQAAIGASYQYLKFDESKGRKFGMIYGTVSVPISDWWGGSHELNERKLKERIAENNFKDNSELLLLQMEKSWQDLGEAYTQCLLSNESKEQAAENLKVNKDSYDNGMITVSDFLEAQALLQQAEDQLTDAKSDYMIKKIIYLQVTGR